VRAEGGRGTVDTCLALGVPLEACIGKAPPATTKDETERAEETEGLPAGPDDKEPAKEVAKVSQTARAGTAPSAYAFVSLLCLLVPFLAMFRRKHE
jgi:hypothetical protein